MEPVTTVATAWTIAKTAGEISKKLYEFGKGLKEREMKQQLDEITDTVRELKQSASELEDENRDLREKLRFKSDEYEFRNPYWYHKANPAQPLCPKCFASSIAAAMARLAEGVQKSGETHSRCLVCDNYFVERRAPKAQEPEERPGELPFG
jgi:hypothetical protein